MEPIALSSSPDQTFSPYKQIRRNPKRNIQTAVCRPSENFSPANRLSNLRSGGHALLGPPPYVSPSLSFPVSIAEKQQHPQAKPPLLPLPINSKPCLRNRGVSWPPTNRKTNKVRDQDPTPKKPKPSSGTASKKQDSGSGSGSTDRFVIASTDRLGPEPSDLPKEVSRVMKPFVAFEDESEKLSGSVFYQSPPPSSLPLPKFSLRPKLSCNAEVGGIDAGATDNLRRLLRLL